MNKRKYKSIAIDINCYRKIEDLTTVLTPGLTLSKAQVVRTLVNQKVQAKIPMKQSLDYSQNTHLNKEQKY